MAAENGLTPLAPGLLSLIASIPTTSNAEPLEEPLTFQVNSHLELHAKVHKLLFFFV
jgi:hypothetical protein